MSLEISRERIYKDIKGGLALELTGMAQGRKRSQGNHSGIADFCIQ